MRLSPETATAIKRAVADCFGPGARVLLFGSRVDDSRRGGDIDLVIEADLMDTEMVAHAEVSLLARLVRVVGERKVDVLVSYPGRRSRPEILKVALETGIPL
jgi:predicted nucleotidyltransferase